MLIEGSNGWNEWIDSYIKYALPPESAELKLVDGQKGKLVLEITSGNQTIALGDWEKEGLPTYYLNNLAKLSASLHSYEEFLPHLPEQSAIIRKKLVINGPLPEVQISL